MVNVSQAIAQTTTELSKAGVDRPGFEAELLVAHCLGTRRHELLLKADDLLTPAQAHCLSQLVERRLAREPIQYILGHWEFWSLDLIVANGVFIPRPETETVVEAAVDFLQHSFQAGAGGEALVLDIATGTGAIAIAIAKELGRRCKTVATDISMAALRCARQNVLAQRLSDRVFLVCTDLAAALCGDRFAGRFSLVVCNPPYIPTETIERLQPEVSQYEPRLALDGGPEGLSFYPRLFLAASTLLHAGGALICEIDPAMTDRVEALCLPHRAALSRPRFLRDLNGDPRVAILVRR